MTNPRPVLTAESTIREVYSYTTHITDPQEAKEYFEYLVRWHVDKWGDTREEAERIERSNIGYYAGYYDVQTRARVEILFNAQHPIFGSSIPTADEAFNEGVKLWQGRQKAE